MLHDFLTTFNAGELSPLMGDRTQVEKYRSGASRMQNMLPLPQGPAMKRPGTVYIADAMSSLSTGKLIGFNFANSTYGVLEIVGASGRIWESNSVVSSTLSLPWTGGAHAAVHWAQVNNLIFAAHGSYPPWAITNASSVFSAAQVSFTAAGNYPPLLDENTTDVTLTPSATTGSGVTLTASAATFTSDNVGSCYELAQVRTSSFSEITLGDDAVKATLKLTISGQPSDGHTLSLAGRTYTFKSSGRTAVDQVKIADGQDEDTDDTADNLLNAVNSGGVGAEPNKHVEIERLGGEKATAAFGIATATELASTDTITIGKITYNFTVTTDTTKRFQVRRETGGTSAQDLQGTLENLMRAINRTPPADPDNPNRKYFYYDATTQDEGTPQHPDVEAVSVTVNGSGYQLNIRARNEGAGGNNIATTASVAGAHAWGGATMSGGKTYLMVRSLESGTVGNDYHVILGADYSWIEIPGGASDTDDNLAGGAEETSNSTAITVLGKYEVRSTGRWTGTLQLQESRDNGSTWATIRAWTATHGDYNVSFEGEQVLPTSMRLTFTGHGEPIDNTYPRAQLEPVDGFHRGLVVVTGYTSSTVVTVTVVRPLLSTAATKYWSEGAWSARRGYPRTVCFHQNRLWFAGTTYEPNKVWASQLGDFLNFRYSSSDDGAMAFQIASIDLQNIVWLASANGLVIGTSTSEWLAREADGQTAITPTNPPVFRQQSSYGSEPIQPVIIGDSVIFIERYGRRVRRMFYDAGTNAYVASNLTVLAEHITEGGITSLAVQKRPETIIWCKVANNSQGFACLTIDMEQNVYAWSRHSATFHNFESVASVNGPDGEELWFMATVSGSPSTRVIERADINTLNRSLSTSMNAVHLDCATVKSGAGFTEIDVAPVLINKTLTLRYANGTETTMLAEASPLTIPSTTWCAVGIKILSQLTTMRLDYQLKDGTSQGRALTITSCVVRVNKSQGGGAMAGPFDQSSTQALSYSTATTTYSGSVEVGLHSCSENDGKVTLYHDKSWPFTVTGLILRVDFGDDAAHKYLASDT